MSEISDDPSIIQPIFDELKNNFKSQQTKDISFRKDALKNLLRGYNEMREDFDLALKEDLGSNPFMAILTTHSIFEGEAKHILSNF
jgi:aldehyde dehydrogenase (NAD+)